MRTYARSLLIVKQLTQICSSCSRAYQTTIRLKQILMLMAISISAVALISDRHSIKIVTVILSLVLLIMAVVANQVKTKFERA